MKRQYCCPAIRAIINTALVVVVGAVVDVKAQISVGVPSSITETFSNLPPATSWSTLSLPGGAGAPEDVASLDAFINGPTNGASAITAAVTSNVGDPPGTSAVAQWSSTGFYLQTRPTGNAVTLLMATLRNHVGATIHYFTLEYEYQQRQAGAAVEAVRGHRVYFSTSGAAGTWVVLGNFGNGTPENTPQPTNILVNLSAAGTSWAPETLMYILFADDNSVPGPDYANGIDNFRVTSVIVDGETCLGITNQTSNITVPERGAATFSIMATGTPQFIQWYRNGTAIPGANSATYTIPSVIYPGDNGAQFRAVVTNTLCTATSTVKTLTVLQDSNPPVVIRAVGDIDPTKVHLTFSEPLDSITINETAFEVFVTGTVPNGSINTFGAALTNGTNVTITTDPRQPSRGYSVNILDVRDASSGSNLINPNPTQVPIIATVQLIGFDTDNVWNYFLGSDIFGTGWEQPGYNDSTWLSGPAGLGLDSSVNGVPIRTTIAYTAQSEPVWFRKHFNFPGRTNGVVLTLRDVVEDGAVYYLNGQEIFRHNVSAGPLTYATRATAGQADPTPIQGPFNLAITNLLPGDNVLAVVVVQSGATSSDVELAVELTATIDEFVPPGSPRIISQPQSQTIIEGANVTFSVIVEGSIPLFYTWKKNGVAIPGATNSTYSITGVAPADAGGYSVSVTNSLGGTNSAVATLTAPCDCTPPFIVSAIGSTNLKVVVVTLHDPLPGRGINLASASDPTHYQIDLRGGGGNLIITSAVAVVIGTNTVVTLMTDLPRVFGQDYNVILDNVVDNSVAQNPVTPNTAPIAATVVLFPFTQIWRYDQSGNDLGSAWKEPFYNDGAWLGGAGVLGFETTSNTLFFLNSIAPPFGTNTVLSLTNSTGAGIGGTNVTFYFRTTVNVPLNLASAKFVARAYIDDGAIIYVNGVERLRYNMTNGPGYTNFANAALTEPTPTPQATFIVSNLSGFVVGNNVIAVEVHQDSRASSDIDFGMQLEALVTSFIHGDFRVLRVSQSTVDGRVTVTWMGGGTLQSADEFHPPQRCPEFGPCPPMPITLWTNVPGAPTSPYTFTPAGNKFFRVLQ